jgi:aryl-alcohol dehydrogenase-like predicted oxidoreductase
MEYRNLGRSGLKVSRLCLGTMNFGWHTSEQDSFALMDKAVEMGINFFDTANVYGWKLGEGVTEQIIGRWLAQGNGRRDKIVLATKVFNKMGEGPNDLNLSAYHIRKACDDSLRRLQTDHIDLYQMHHVDRSTPWEEIWQAMELEKAKEGRRSEERTGKLIEKNHGKLEKYEPLCREIGEKPGDVALAWLLHNPAVTSPIIGPRTLEQLTGAAHALVLKLSDETLKKLDEIWPGPGGEAPEAYAW